LIAVVRGKRQVPPQVKEEMEKRKGSVEWPAEIRQFILDRLEQEKRKENALRVEQMLKGVRTLQKGATAKLVREDRDHGHDHRY
jgi:hypothetical protein